MQNETVENAVNTFIENTTSFLNRSKVDEPTKRVFEKFIKEVANLTKAISTQND